ncbi:hypothetical protein T484DRAFT_1922263, partial [Baffinella frigidus]
PETVLYSPETDPGPLHDWSTFRQNKPEQAWTLQVKVGQCRAKGPPIALVTVRGHGVSRHAAAGDTRVRERLHVRAAPALQRRRGRLQDGEWREGRKGSGGKDGRAPPHFGVSFVPLGRRRTRSVL